MLSLPPRRSADNLTTKSNVREEACPGQKEVPVWDDMRRDNELQGLPRHVLALRTESRRAEIIPKKRRRNSADEGDDSDRFERVQRSVGQYCACSCVGRTG